MAYFPYLFKFQWCLAQYNILDLILIEVMIILLLLFNLSLTVVIIKLCDMEYCRLVFV